jgi:hypothetical protein
MTGDERKRAFKSKVAADGTTLAMAALTECGVTWEHLSRGISDAYETPLSADVKQKFAHYLGFSTEYVFGPSAEAGAAQKVG